MPTKTTTKANTKTEPEKEEQVSTQEVKQEKTLSEQLKGPSGRIQVSINVVYEDKYNEKIALSFELSKLRSLIQGSGPDAGNEAIGKFYDNISAKGRDLLKDALSVASTR